MLGVEVPPVKWRGETATLRCMYDMAGASLYSVNWYKDGMEFYRYMPSRPQPKTTFAGVPGANVNVSVFSTRQQRRGGRARVEDLEVRVFTETDRAGTASHPSLAGGSSRRYSLFRRDSFGRSQGAVPTARSVAPRRGSSDRTAPVHRRIRPLAPATLQPGRVSLCR